MPSAIPRAWRAARIPRLASERTGGLVKFAWYDGAVAKEGVYQHAPPEKLRQADFPAANHVFRRFDLVLVGEKGRMFFGRSRQDWVFKPGTLTTDFTDPPKTLPRVAAAPTWNGSTRSRPARPRS